MSEVCKAHPLADEWPMMDDDDLEGMADDIKAHGLREAIWLKCAILVGRKWEIWASMLTNPRTRLAE